MHGFVDTFRHKMSIGRIAFLGILISGVAVLLFILAACMTDGDLPQTPSEWFVSIIGSVMVWPTVLAARIFGADSLGLAFWVLWILGGLFWALLLELVIFSRHDHVA